MPNIQINYQLEQLPGRRTGSEGRLNNSCTVAAIFSFCYSHCCTKVLH